MLPFTSARTVISESPVATGIAMSQDPLSRGPEGLKMGQI